MKRPLVALIALLPLICACEKTIVLNSGSMAPTISKGERVTFDISSYRHDHPTRWDIVVFEHPNKEILDIKRVVGLPGESISFTAQGLAIGGVVLMQPDSLGSIFYKSMGKMDAASWLSYTIPDNKYFVLGDNPDGSVDSRIYGPVRRNSIIGKVKVK